MNTDEYGEVINGENTYREVGHYLSAGNTCLIGWTDGEGTHFDVLFAIRVPFTGTNIQGGIRSSDLFVSVMRHGAFGFEIDDAETHPGYYEEKLGRMGIPCAEKFAELVNGVRRDLDRRKKNLSL